MALDEPRRIPRERLKRRSLMGRRFLEMAGLSLSVAAFSFLIGLLMRVFLGFEV